jgi:hypothetical protein
MFASSEFCKIYLRVTSGYSFGSVVGKAIAFTGIGAVIVLNYAYQIVIFQNKLSFAKLDVIKNKGHMFRLPEPPGLGKNLSDPEFATETGV